LLAPWRDLVIKQPSMFIAGERDDVLKFPNSHAHMAHFTNTLPGLRGCHIMQGAGHWIQRERASAVNELLLGFLRLYLVRTLPVRLHAGAAISLATRSATAGSRRALG